MKKLPIALEIPHVGTKTPPELKKYSVVSSEALGIDRDKFADVLYQKQEVKKELVFPYWRTYIDVNRAPNDFGTDGIIKTQTMFGEQIYTDPNGLPDATKNLLQEKYIQPYFQEKLYSMASDPQIEAFFFGHTMDYSGHVTHTSNDTGKLRPIFTLANGGLEESTPLKKMEYLQDIIRQQLKNLNLENVNFEKDIEINQPFQGKSISRIENYLEGRPAVLLEVNKDLLEKHATNIIETRRIIKKTLLGLLEK